MKNEVVGCEFKSRQPSIGQPRLHSRDRPTYLLFAVPAHFFLTLCLANGSAADEHQTSLTARNSALSPAESLEQTRVAEGYQLQLIASEPLVVDPVEVAFDDAGRMWVVEMRDYPFRVADRPNGRLTVVTDSDDDGVLDQTTVFADQLEMPTGLALWRDGVIVTLAGEVAFFRDLDGDFVADEKQQWLTGFTIENEQLRANHPRLGPDGWWYIACGLRGGEIRLGSHFQPATSAQTTPLRVGSRDIRFHPDNQTLEAVTGPAQFGLGFDLLGSRFFCSNRNPAVQVVFEQADLTSNPLVGLVPSTVDVLPAGADSRVFPLVDAWTTSNLHAGQFTAACGLFLTNRNGSLEECYVCEPTGSLVKRATLQRATSQLVPVSEAQNVGDASSVGVKAAEKDAEVEWLASRDPWFRPVNVTLDPSGDIVIVDMHRAVIEHPKWVPDELKNRPDERWGDSHGRVFRISTRVNPSSATESAANELARTQWLAQLRRQPLRERSTAELITLLGQDNPWIRETVSRLLIERKDLSAISLLQVQAQDRKLNDATRICSLRLACNLSGEFPTEVVSALESESSERIVAATLRILRQQAVFDQATMAQLTDAITKLSKRSGPAQFEALLCMSELSTEVDQETLNQIALEGNPFLLVAAGKAFSGYPEQLLEKWLLALNSAEFETTLADPVISDATEKLVSAIVKQGKTSEQPMDNALDMLKSDCKPSCKLACLSAAAAWLDSSDNAKVTGPSDDPARFWSMVSSLSTDHDASVSLRRAALKLLGYSTSVETKGCLMKMARDAREIDLLPEILSAWAKTEDPACDQELEALLVSGAPAARRTAAALIANHPRRLDSIANKLQAGDLDPKSIGALELNLFRDRSQGPPRQLMQQALDSLVNSDRREIVDRYQTALSLNGKRDQGKAVFSKNCAGCHKIGDVGVDIGPDISDSRTKQPLQLLTSILDPNLAIDNNYYRFVVLTIDGRIVEGMIAEESEEAIIFVSQDNQRKVIFREDIAQLKATGVSLMPEGLEAQIDQQAMADLIAFIKEWRYQAAAIPGL